MPTKTRLQELLDSCSQNPNQAREYAMQILAVTGHAPLSDRAQMRARFSDQQHSPGLVPIVQPMLAPSRWIEVTGIPKLAPQEEWLSGRIQFQFSPGFLIAMRGTAVYEKRDAQQQLTDWESDLGTFRAAGMMLQFNGGEHLVTSGDAETWLWYADAFGMAHQIAPMLRRVEASDVLNVSLRNDFPVGLHTLILSLSFLYLADRDLPETLAAVDTQPAR
jgi:hypothetical protein